MGKSNPDPPDYRPLMKATNKATRSMERLGNRQLKFARNMYKDAKPQMQEIAGLQIEAQQNQNKQGVDYYDYMKSTYRPLEQEIVANAREFNTDAYREQLAGKAASDAGLAFSRTQAANERSMASMGVNPNSGRFAGLSNASGLAQAATRAAAMSGTRVQADQIGYGRMMDAAGMGKGLPATSVAAFNSASNAGLAAGNALQSAGQNYMANSAIGVGTIGSGHEMNINGLSNVLNAQTNAYVNSNDSFLGDLGGILGAGAGLITAFSDRRLKRNIEKVGVDAATGLNLYKFTYVNDPDTHYIGVMADEVEPIYPDAVVERDGYKAVNYAKLGIEFKETP